MPRDKIDVSLSLEHLGILNHRGELDAELEPDLDEALRLRLFRTMLLARRFDERLLELQRQGRIGTFAPVKGQEASQVGAVSALSDDDWFVPSYRETAAALWRGWTPKDITVFNAGYNEGAAIPEDAKDFPMAVPVASQIPHAVGLGYAARLNQTDEVVMVFFGDGATSEGDFHEALNFAGAFRLPVVFVCENNQWAISLPRERQTAAATLAQKAMAYGLPGIQVDGNDVLAVHVAAREAVDRARSGDGPTLIECVTYRLSLHTTADDPTRYRRDEEVEEWTKRDPIPRFRDYLIRKGDLDEDAVEALAEEIEDEVKGVWKSAEAAIRGLAGPEVMFEHIYGEPTPALEKQAEALVSGLGSGASDV